ncbi:MAG: hypothetical protein AAGN46_17140 [Acidobacteriota bacterium]
MVTAEERRARSQSRHSARGYNLVVLVVAATVLTVWVAAALPLWSHQIQRDKQAELIFRGLQYAEAIRVFQARFNRAPTNLDELIEVEPRSVRQLYPNPLRDDGRWGLIPVGLNPNQPPGGEAPNPSGDLTGPTEDEDDDGALGSFDPGSRQAKKPAVILSRDREDRFAPKPNVPIRGVYNPDDADQALSFLGSKSPAEWQFTVELVSGQQQGTPDSPGFVRPFLAWVIGRPFPPGITPLLPQPSNQVKPPAPPEGGPPSGDQPPSGDTPPAVDPTIPGRLDIRK